MSLSDLPRDPICYRQPDAFDLGARTRALKSKPLKPNETQRAERLLAKSQDHRVLRRVPDVDDWKLAPVTGPTRRALYIDIKTTGPSANHDQIMALGAVTFDYDLRTGAIAAIEAPIGLDDPEPRALNALAQGVDLVIAHDAAFARPMLENLCATYERMNWASVLDEIDWPMEGLAVARVDDLLARLGWFNESTDTKCQACAGVFLLNHPLPRSRTLALRLLLNHARRPRWAIRASNTPFEKRDALRLRGYRWDGGNGRNASAWWKMTEEADADIAWLNAAIYSEPRSITPTLIPASRRYSARMWPSAEHRC